MYLGWCFRVFLSPFHSDDVSLQLTGLTHHPVERIGHLCEGYTHRRVLMSTKQYYERSTTSTSGNSHPCIMNHVQSLINRTLESRRVYLEGIADGQTNQASIDPEVERVGETSLDCSKQSREEDDECTDEL